MKRIRYQDMSPERRAEFDKIRKFADLSPEEREFRRWVESGKAFVARSNGDSDLITFTFGDQVIELTEDRATHVLPE